MGTTELLERARSAFADRVWPSAFRDFAAADRRSALDPDDLERWATAAYLSGHDDACTDAWSRAHEGWRERGDEQRAVRCAFWLGFALVQRGDMAQGGGWLGRAGRLVEEHRLDIVERGYLLVPAGLMAMGAGEHDVALERFVEAESLASRFADDDLAALGRLGQGEALLRIGQMSDGLSLFDQAMVAVTAGETSPIVSGLIYCAVIDICQRVFDLRRAHEWTAALDRWCRDQPGLVPYRGQCLVHRAQVLQLRGEWAAAMVEVEQAQQRLSDPPHPAVGMAHYQLGELHRLRGDTESAEGAYRRAHAAGRDPQPGLSLLRLASGHADTAIAGIASALDAAPDRAARTRLLPAYAHIMLAVGRTDDARIAVEELEELAAGARATMLGAIADETRGALAIADGDARSAIAPLQRALEAWQVLGAPYEIAHVRLLLADACRRLGDRDRAELECDAARTVFEQLGAAPALEHLDRLDRYVAGPSVDEPATDATVTDRERQVLGLVAGGCTNREIAAELSISEKTVERHLGNIFVKLGVTNRAAATAHAYDRGLIQPRDH